MHRIDVFAAFTGIAGALMLALMLPAAWGFTAFLMSNVAWMAFSARRRQWPLFAQQSAFLLTSVLGLWNAWLRPWMG